jgi:hypothetical protein
MSSIMDKVKHYWYYLTFDATKDYGRAVPICGKYTDIDVNNNSVIQRLRQEADLRLPRGLYYEIRAKIPTDFGRDKGLAWYHAPGMYSEEPNLRIIPAGGYYRVGGFYANND